MSLQARTADLPLFATPEPERAKAESVLDRMARERRAWLERMRAALAGLYEHRVTTWGALRHPAFVTADDARRLMRDMPDLALPEGASPNTMGALFRTREWECIDRGHVSTTIGSHGNLLARWRYVGPRNGDAA
jgi:hypothetical protein